ncbi:unnamed protein product [Rotaria sp. Silwood2]|nr:unnamed protein product [Rotaria sp. Silwood2]CAF3286561.1 unnamed protein product [Rotaria sp. Silwood2]CAF4173463.1 unnamed protein product [Rotaria sp. Silwood2]CAF4291206.1 unnamed protein product [Rotaria sp. Silwood2]CAF4298342.1 unnamed protein product [Rotaria sp. Silwood2]
MYNLSVTLCEIIAVSSWKKIIFHPNASLKPVDNRENANEVSYNASIAQDNQQLARSAKSDVDKVPSSISGEGIRVVNLHRPANDEGLGYSLQYNNNYFLVHYVGDDSPAANSGLRLNDVILSVNQQSTENMTHENLMALVGECSDVEFIVQPLEEYLRSNYRSTQNKQSSPTHSRKNNKFKTWVLKVMKKSTNR